MQFFPLPVLPEALSPTETTQLRSGFNWKKTHRLRELDAKGRPSLYYALILIENREQVHFLDQLEIHFFAGAQQGNV